MAKFRKVVAIGVSVAALAVAGSAFAQAAQGSDGTDEASSGDIIVTANKREQSINDVGLTIQAATAETLGNRGINSVGDLAKLVPGFTATQSTFQTPIYTLRGVGLYDATVGAAPAVAIYTDQVPRNFPMMSDGLELDIERVEVLKGPQGTLFGQSSTGGAINYIVGKPTGELKAGFDASIERYGKADIGAFISGPLGENLKGRLAVRGITGGAWQRSVSRPDDKNGATRKLMGRLSLDFEPSSAFRVQASFTAAQDHSDPQAPQYVNSFYNIYSTATLAAANANAATRNPFGYVDNALYALLTTPGSPGFRADHVGNQSLAVARMNGVGDINAFRPQIAAGTRALLGSPRVATPQAADWTPGFLRGARNDYYQGLLRVDINLSDDITLTSLTAFAKSNLDRTIDLDGTVAESLNIPSFGSIKTFNQELRLSGKSDRLDWIIGGTYDNLKTSDNNDYILFDYIGSNPFGTTAVASRTNGPVLLTTNLFDTKLKTLAVFANAEFKLTDQLSISGGIRYTDNKQTATYCYNDPAKDTLQTTSALFGTLSQLVGGAPATFRINPGQCFPAGDGTPGRPFGIATLTPVPNQQNENNVSFRFGLNYKLASGGLLYATVSQGYKAGVFSNIGASSISQYSPAVQEKLNSYEAGFKLPLADRKLQLNGAFFYYDYTNKQTRAKVSDPVWGLLEKLVNVPKSRIWGLEGELVARPVDGLTLAAGATYLKSRVTSNFSQSLGGQAVYNSMGFTGNFKDSKLPFTPEFTANADIQYEWTMGGIKPFLGATVVHQGKSVATYENAILRADFFQIPSYATLDLRAGFGSEDDRWKLMFYGRNVTNKYYVIAPTFYHDAYFNLVGKPAIYGAQFSFRY